MMSKSPTSRLSFFFFSLALVSSMSLPRVCNAAIRCREAEREALLELKQRFDDPSNRLTSWVGKDCCAWKGIGCSNVTGHVIKLNLRNEHVFYDEWDKFTLRGDISTASSLQSLEELTHLDLSGNDFSAHTIPAFFGSFGSLTYLNLSLACFSGRVPDELGNLSALRHLDLSYNYYTSDDYYDSTHFLYVENPGWIARLTSLRHLNMSDVSFGGASSWFEALNALPHIQDVELVGCELGPFPHSPSHLNFKSLLTLNLADNILMDVPEPVWVYNITTLVSLNFRWIRIHWSSMNGSISKLTSLRVLDLSGSSISKNFLLSLSNLCNLQILILEGVSIKHLLSNLKMVLSRCLMYNLEELHLGNNQFNGHFPSWLSNMKNLKYIDLSYNLLQGSLQVSPESLTSLQYLDLNFNKLNGTIGESIGQLKNLVHLYLSSNSLSLSLIHLGNLSSLKYLDISGNTLFMEDTNDWVPPFQLQSLWMDNCNIVPRPHFPKWLQTQTTLSSLSLTNARIQDTIPSWFPSSLKYLYLNNNEIGGKLTHFFQNLTRLDLSYNSLSGYLPSQMAIMMPSLEYLDLSNNKFIGDLPQNFTKLQILILFNNSFSGHFPSQMANMMPSLKYLDLSDNEFIGVMPQNFTKLQRLDLAKNSFSGQLPLQMGNMMPSLEYLDISDNKFTGVMPQNFTKLQRLDLSKNSFSGQLPLQMGNMMPSLEHLDLSDNKCTGVMPQNFTKLQRLDLSKNSFSGQLPLQMGNMMPSLEYLDLSDNKFTDVMPQNFTKLQRLDLSKTSFSGQLPLQMGNMIPSLEYLDLSDNKFTGVMPQNFTKLQILDLSKNSFSGHLPLQMGNMMPSLKYLDLSNNKFFGDIPQNFTNLYVLYLSNNTFSGHLNPTINNTISNLFHLDLSINNLNGNIPRSLCQMNSLFELQLFENNFSGELPNCWNNLFEVKIFDISLNRLHGEIPDSLCNQQRLQTLRLSYNNLSGRIPLCLQNCTELMVVDAGYNNFTGNIPTWPLDSLSSLQALILRSNSLSGNIHELSQLISLQILDLSNNHFTGSIERSFSNFTAMKSSSENYYNYYSYCNGNGSIIGNSWLLLFIKGNEHKYKYVCSRGLVVVIDLSDNDLSGYIPKELGNLHGLQSLNLSGNNFIGEIPSSINGMQKLEVLDLSRNNLSGKIPSTLADLTFLGILNLSYNNLLGSIPTGRQLQTFDQSSYIGNPNLCGPPVEKMCTNDTKIEEGNRHDNDRKETIWLFTSSALGFIMGFWGICGTLLLHKRWRILYFCAVDYTFDKLCVKMLLHVRRKYF